MNKYIYILIMLLVVASAACFAYDNDGRDANGNGLKSGGPHRTINELALNNFIAKMQKENAQEKVAI